MNIIEQTEALKDLPDQRLMQEMQAPTGFAPQFLVLSELKRRKRMRDEYQRQQAADMQTVAEETITAAGVPQGGIMQMAKAMNPNSSIAQNTGMDQAPQMQPTRMADGGVVKMLQGGAVTAQPDGQGGYILVQRNQQISDRRFPNFSEANAAARALRESDAQPFQVDRILSGFETVGPAMPEEPSALSMVNPDPQAFVANDPMRRQLQLRQAAGTREDPSVGGIASLDPLGRAFMDEYRADMSGMQGIPSGGEGIGSVDNLQTLMPSYQEQTIPDAALPAAPRFVSEDQRAEEDAQMELARMAGAVPLADMVSEMSGNKAVDFDASTPDASIGSAPTLESALANRPGFRTSPLDTIEGVISGKTPNEKSNEFLEYFQGLKTPDDENPMVSLVEGAIDKVKSPTLRSPDDAVEQVRRQAASTLSGNEFSLPPDQGFPFPVDAPEETSPEADPLNILNVLPALTETSSGDEIVDKATEIMEERNIPLSQQMIDAGFTGGDIDPSDLPAPRSASSELIDDGFTGSEDAPFLTPTVKGDGGGDGGDGGGDTPTTTRTGTGSAMGSIEERIAKMLDEREKSVESDKWMALAQAGMALMSSKSPTLGGAIGEAGLAGIGALKKGKAQYDKDVLSLLGMQQKIDAAKDLAAYRQATLSKKGTSTKGLNQEIDDARAYLNALQSEAKSYRRVAEGDAAMGTLDRVIDMTPPDLKANIIAAEDRLRKLMELRSSLGTSAFDATK